MTRLLLMLSILLLTPGTLAFAQTQNTQLSVVNIVNPRSALFIHCGEGYRVRAYAQRCTKLVQQVSGLWTERNPGGVWVLKVFPAPGGGFSVLGFASFPLGNLKPYNVLIRVPLDEEVEEQAKAMVRTAMVNLAATIVLEEDMLSFVQKSFPQTLQPAELSPLDPKGKGLVPLTRPPNQLSPLQQ